MQFVYIVIAMIMSVGVSSFAFPDSQNKLAQTTSRNMAIAYEEQAAVLARSIRRDVQLRPSQYRQISEKRQMTLTSQQSEAAAFGGYQNNGRYTFSLTSAGQVVPKLTNKALKGPSGLNSTADVVVESLSSPDDGRAIGKINLAQIGLR
jgi:hypothetical protein